MTRSYDDSRFDDPVWQWMRAVEENAHALASLRDTVASLRQAIEASDLGEAGRCPDYPPDEIDP